MVVMSGTPTKNVPVNSSSEIRNTKMALARMPGSASGRVTVRNASKADAPRLRAASSSSRSIAAKAAVATPHREHEPLDGVDQHHPGVGPVQAEAVEDVRDVHVHRDRRKGLRQKKEEQKQAPPGKVAASQGEPCRDGDGEARGHRREGDEHRVDERLHRVPLRAEHPFPERKAPFERKLVREVPHLCDRPQEQVGDRSEDREGEQGENQRPKEGGQQRDGGHAGLPPSRIPWRR